MTNGLFAKETGDATNKKKDLKAEVLANEITCTVSSTSFCLGEPVAIAFIASGTYNSGNIFTAQLSDAAGSFASPINIGTLTGSVSGIIHTIPTNITSGNGYRIRVNASNLSTTGLDNAFNITINQNVIPTFTSISPICSGAAKPVLPLTSNNGIIGTWTPASVSNSVSAIYNFTPSMGQCATSTTLSIVINPNGTPTFTAIAPICAGQNLAPLPTTSNNGITGTWMPSLNKNATTTYTFAPHVGQCTSTPAVLTIVVNPKPNPIIATVNDLHDIYVDNSTIVQNLLLDSQLSGSYSFTWYEDGVELIGATSSTYLIDTFSANSTRNYTVRATNSATGCLATSLAFVVNQSPVPPPSGNKIQVFTVGQTLANIVLAGSNIQWYSGATNNKLSSIQKINTLLPMNTLLVNGITYYASQTINGYESPTRLAVTAQFSLSTNKFDLKNLEYSPNPIVNILNIKSTEIIKNVTVYNILGQEVYSRKFNNSELKLELSHLVSGNYFIKVESGNKQQVFKVIKK